MNPIYKDPTQPIEGRVDDLLSCMTIEEKIGQMAQADIRGIKPKDVTAYYIGSILSGGGAAPTPNTPQAWADMVAEFQTCALKTRLGIPMIYGVDAVHGHSNMIGAVIFPHNIGLGATRDEALVEQAGRITAAEVVATGIHWSFAPTVAVAQDIRWGRTYESYSENTALVAKLGAAYLRGLQHKTATTAQVLGSAKHFVGDGGTRWGTTSHYPWIDWGNAWYSPDDKWSIDQGTTDIDEATLRNVHLPPYIEAIKAGARNIMVSYSSWGGLKMHAHKYLLTDLLKGELGFAGFLVSDWMGVDQLGPDNYTNLVTSINAGLDMVMIPFEYRRFINDMQCAVENGDIPMARINDAVRRILRVKFELGLFEQPFVDKTLAAQVGCASHRAVAREAVQKSLVLLKNEGGVLPLAKETPLILVAGQAADDIGLQCGGWTIEWMGAAGNITPGTTLLTAIRRSVSEETVVQFEPEGNFALDGNPADVGMVVLSEPPYAEGAGDRADLSLAQADMALLERMRAQCHRLVVILYSGRPLIITKQLPLMDALVAAWLPGTEGQGIADVLFGDIPFTGKLSFTWPRSMAQVSKKESIEHDEGPLFFYGFGLLNNHLSR